MNRHTSVMKCSWNDWNDKNNNFQFSLQHQGGSAEIRHCPCQGHRTQLGDAASAPGQAQGHNSKPKQLPGMQCHQDSWIQQSPEPLEIFPHPVRAQNEVAGTAHVLLAGLTLHTEREDSRAAFQPGLLKWQNNSHLFQSF